MQASVGKGLQHSSGRVISLGRLMMAILFLVAILLDASQPARGALAAYAVLGLYAFLAAVIVALTWRNWWLDAKLALPAHGLDIVLFAILVLLTEGYTSPFFAFFVFVLLAAAIRWNWRATALTAVLVTLLYMLVGMLGLASSDTFELQRFVVRAGQLVILSLTLIWFGANRQLMRFETGDGKLFAPLSLDESPQETAVRAAMTRSGAGSGIFVWRDRDADNYSSIAMGSKGVSVAKVAAGQMKASAGTTFLYDLQRGRALEKDADRNPIYRTTNELLGKPSKALALTEGLAIPVRSDEGEGILFLEGIRGLSTDYLELGDQLANEVTSQIRRHALLKAAEENAEARSRLTLARDLHDSVVQFLAGAAFRLEAMKRSKEFGRDLEPELNELKQLMLQEQRELRSFITSLRSGPMAAFSDLSKDLEALAERLARQWDVSCELVVEPAAMTIPTRLRLDALQMMREAVANAVRHASATTVTVKLAAVPDELRLEFINDGAKFRKRGGRLEMPSSLQERVHLAGGVLAMSRGMGVTKLSISLPIGESNR